MVFIEDVQRPPLPDWLLYVLDDTVILPTAFWLILIIALLVMIYKLWPIISKFVTIVDHVSGLPDFIDTMNKRAEVDNEWRADINEWRDTVDAKMDDIHHQTHTNGGGSIKDDVLVIKKEVLLIREDFERADKALREDLEATQETKRNPYD